MKIICTQENLKRGLTIVSATVKRAAALPILANVLISTEEGRIKLATTNLEMGATFFIRGKIEKEGKITAPAQLLSGFVSNLPPTKILFESDGRELSLRCENYKAKIRCLDPQEFPLIPKIQDSSLTKVQAKLLRDALAKVVFAAAKEESRPEISGVFFGLKDDKMRLAATDSYRLAESVFALPQNIKREASFIVPQATCLELLRILSKSEDEVEIFASENQIKFKISEAELTSRLVEGQYPDYTKIIPEKFSAKFKISADDFITALRSASLFSKADTNEVEINLSPKSGTLEIKSSSGERGANDILLKGKGEGKDEAITFNYQYVLEGLLAVGSDFLNLTLDGDVGPAAIAPDGKQGYTYVIMPIKK